MTAKYTHTLDIDDPLSVQQGANTFYYHKDGLGSVVNLTDGTGTLVKDYTYKSFGEIFSETGTLAQPFTFTGREYDPESGLYFYRARYYDPRAGRFLTKDPIGFASGDVNLYRAMRNNPINFVDPWGLKEWIFIIAGGGGGITPIAVEGGTYYLVDPSTGIYHQWGYGSLGGGLGFGWALQIEGGIFEGPDDPTKISSCSLTVSGFAAAGKGISGQYTGTSFWGQGEAGTTAGFAAGAGAGISGMFTYSYYVGKGDVIPEKYLNLNKELQKKAYRKVR